MTAGARRFVPALLLVLAGCTTSPSTGAPPVAAPPFAGCAALLAAPAETRPPQRSGIARTGRRLPDVTLPCFTGGEQVRLSDVRGPAVVNLWGVWCAPCREELPVMQRLADRTAGRLHVVGVDTWDDRPAAASFAVDKAITMPTLYDRDKQLMSALGKANLPVTVFVDGDGGTFVYNGTALTDTTLADLVVKHLSVTP